MMNRMYVLMERRGGVRFGCMVARYGEYICMYDLPLLVICFGMVVVLLLTPVVAAAVSAPLD
jgi:hypothetical protein